jgi:putative transposase
VQSLRQERLDHFVAFGEAHRRHLVAEYVRYYNKHRPNQGVGDRPLSMTEPTSDADPPSAEPTPLGTVRCEERLGGLLKHYHRAAA